MSDALLRHADNRFAVDGDVLVRNLAARVRALEAERDALRRDAERYRWLRQRAAAQDVLLRRALYEDELDQAIDALREGK
jgi:hypothetical protein